jgi:hypothetical protein
VTAAASPNGRASDHVAQRQRDEDNADLTDPDVERPAEVLGEITRAGDFQHHHGKAAEEHQQRGNGFNHAPKLPRAGRWGNGECGKMRKGEREKRLEQFNHGFPNRKS